MKPRIIVPALLVAAMLGAPAFAADRNAGRDTDGAATHARSLSDHGHQARRMEEAMSGKDLCGVLEQQFDQVIKSHENEPTTADAMNMRAAGGRQCASGEAQDGVANLKSALHTIGVTPAA